METLHLDDRLRNAGPDVQIDPRLPAGRYVVSLTVTSERGESRVATLRFTVLTDQSVAPRAGGATSAPRRRR